MLRLLLLFVLTQHSPAYVTDSPSFAKRLDQLYEKLERLTIAPDHVEPSQDSLLAKIDKLNSLGPERELSDEDEELLSAIQEWGMLSPEQLDGVVKDLQGLKDDKSEKLTDGEYSDAEWVDEELQDLGDGDYVQDIGPDDWDDAVDADGTTAKPLVVTPSPLTRQENKIDGFDKDTLTDVDHIAATNMRPTILDATTLTNQEKAVIRREAIEQFKAIMKSRCVTPQPRWLSVRQLAPAADTLYFPPCVLLHRCAADACCCYKENEVCVPVEGKFVTASFLLNRAHESTVPAVRMLFYNHTRCACVPRETLQSNVRTKIEPTHSLNVLKENTPESRQGSDESKIESREGPIPKVTRIEQREVTKPVRIESRQARTEEPRLERDEEITAPPQLRRCTCPGLFIAKMGDEGVCSCVCEWPDLNKRRGCLSLARGREHFGLRDRFCVAQGDCNAPICEYGAYDRVNGLCPQRKIRRMRYRRGRLDKIVV